MTNCIDMKSGENWTMMRGDCCDLIKSLPDNSIDFSVFSPPFSDLYSYSESTADMSNCANDNEFHEHFRYLTRELYRVIKPGRLVAVHCMILPSTKQNHGYIGLRDFRGDIIDSFIDSDTKEMFYAMLRINQRYRDAINTDDFDRASDLKEVIDVLKRDIEKHKKDDGFIFHSEVCIWKDPVTQVTRTKSIGLLHKQMVKDSSISRQGIPDHVVVFRKPGKNENPIEGRLEDWYGDDLELEGDRSIAIWQKIASPVWIDIDQGDTLNYRLAKADEDVRHICPMQLGVVRRCNQLWSKKGDKVLSCFAGVGSEGYVALEMGRKFVGFELKDTYYETACKHLELAEAKAAQPVLF